MTTKEVRIDPAATLNDEITKEISLLEKGHKLDKLISKKFSKRTYKLDLRNKKLVANTRQFGKTQKECK